MWRDDEDDEAARRSDAVAGSILRPDPDGAGDGELAWEADVDELVITRGGDTILRADTERFDDVSVKAFDVDRDGEGDVVGRVPQRRQRGDPRDRGRVQRG